MTDREQAQAELAEKLNTPAPGGPLNVVIDNRALVLRALGLRPLPKFNDDDPRAWVASDD